MTEPTAARPTPPPVVTNTVDRNAGFQTKRFMTWNILNGGTSGGRLARQIKVVRQERPDVLALQECQDFNLNYYRPLWKLCNGTGLMPALLQPSAKAPRMHTALLYNPDSFRLVGEPVVMGAGAVFHTIIRARLRPTETPDTSDAQHPDDWMAFASHFNPWDRDAGLAEARRMTDWGGDWVENAERRVAMLDINCMDREPESWDAVPRNMHARYRTVNADGSFGDADRRSLRVLLQSGWEDPAAHLGIERETTVGYFYDNEKVPQILDHVLISGSVKPVVYRTRSGGVVDTISDHRPTILDCEPT